MMVDVVALRAKCGGSSPFDFAQGQNDDSFFSPQRSENNLGFCGHFLAEGLLWGGEEGGGDETAYDCSNDWRDPEEPELTERPAAGEDCGAGAAGGVDRGVGDRDADEVDQREAEADGDGGEAFGCALVGGAEDDEKEEGGQEHLDEEAGDERGVLG